MNELAQFLLHYLSGDQHYHTCFSPGEKLYKLHRSCHKGHTAAREGSRQVSFVFNEAHSGLLTVQVKTA